MISTILLFHSRNTNLIIISNDILQFPQSAEYRR